MLSRKPAEDRAGSRRRSETCKLIGVEPYAYLADVITRIVEGHPQSRLAELLPCSYPATPNLKAVA